MKLFRLSSLQQIIPLSKDDLKVVATVLFYMCSSISMVMLNKIVLNVTKAPIVFLWMQLIVAVGLLHLAALSGLLTLPTLKWSKCRDVMPLIMVNTIGLSANTICLQYVDASLFQVARSLTLPFTVALSVLFLGKSSSQLVLLSCALIFIGFMVGTALDSLTFDSLGFVFGVFSAGTTAAHAIVIKKTLNIIGDNTMDLVYYNNLLSAIVLLPYILFSGELGLAEKMLISEETNESTLDPLSVFLLGSFLTGFFGFLINIAGFLQIKITSPVTHMVSSSVRGVVQTFVAMGVFGELVSSKRWLGILFTLIGSALYTWVRNQEGEAEKLAKGKHEYELAATKDEEDVETLYESNSVDEKTKELILDFKETEDEIRIMKQTEALLSESTGKSR